MMEKRGDINPKTPDLEKAPGEKTANKPTRDQLDNQDFRKEAADRFADAIASDKIIPFKPKR